MKKILDLTYPIYIESKSVTSFMDVFKTHTDATRVFVVTDENVWKMHDQVFKAFKNEMECFVVRVEPGEQSKSLETYEKVVSHLLNAGIKRDDVLIAFGGGVVGDLTGFIAATLFRGISFIQIPTTIIAQVDSSIGSKVGINTSTGKNLIGAFKDPLFVYMYVPFLSSLEEREFNNGMAEVIKAGVIQSPQLIKSLKQGTFDEDLLMKAIKVKVDIVLKDKFESNIRMKLNLGHTIGHAIEKANGYQSIKHGEAVAWGLVYALKLGIKLGYTKEKDAQEIIDVLTQYDLLNQPIESFDTYIPYVKFDKKNRKDGLHVILVSAIGHVQIVQVDEEVLYGISN